MQIQLVAVDAARVTRTRPGNLDAADLALRCEAGMYNSPPGSAEYTAAFDLCDRALHIDNGNVFALTGMTLRYITPVVEAQSSDPQADIRRADDLVSRALAIDPNYYFAHFAKAYVLMAQGRTQEAVVEGERSLALNPSLSMPTLPSALQTTFWAGRIVLWSLLTRRFASVRATRTCGSYIT
jgi:adenylate cyclase